MVACALSAESPRHLLLLEPFASSFSVCCKSPSWVVDSSVALKMSDPVSSILGGGGGVGESARLPVWVFLGLLFQVAYSCGDMF